VAASRTPAEPADCPCGSGLAYTRCCSPLHQGQPAADAEALMRSRYSAFVFGLHDYLLATWHPDTRPPAGQLQAMPARRWLGLRVDAHRVTGVDRAQVDFVARFRDGGGRAVRQIERSRFVRVGGRWCYLDDRGTAPDAAGAA
jgi:Uncharacterized protein conserved in bacteria